jgi:ABC-type branched-subunit amino acid transport system ATPase component
MAVLHQGEIIIEGEPELVVEDERTQDAYFGT